jgi:phosphonate degradation associated HDIG domain protein
MPRTLTLGDIEALFTQYGQQAYDGSRRESVTALQHALQCAQLADWAHADDTLVAAALLHDLGHFLTPVEGDDEDDRHETIALPYLAGCFGAEVLEPIRLHVAAKRYLVTTDAGYLAGLSPASVHSLALQGGPMTAFEVAEFEARPFAMDAVQLRRWDDLAKTPAQATPALGYYLALLEELQPSPALR